MCTNNAHTHTHQHERLREDDAVELHDVLMVERAHGVGLLDHQLLTLPTLDEGLDGHSYLEGGREGGRG